MSELVELEKFKEEMDGWVKDLSSNQDKLLRSAKETNKIQAQLVEVIDNNTSMLQTLSNRIHRLKERMDQIERRE